MKPSMAVLIASLTFLINVPDLTPLQSKLFSLLNNYTDVLYTGQTHEQSQELTKMAALHALNHVYKTRDRIMKNNEKIKRSQDYGTDIGYLLTFTYLLSGICAIRDSRAPKCWS
jgi:hypothetical protein